MKKTYSLVFEGDLVTAVVPKELAEEIMRVQSAKHIDFAAACRLVAEQSNTGSAEFQKRVKEESLRMYRSRHMLEMNKALQTKYESGVEAGKINAYIRYPCSVCGKNVLWNLCNDSDSNQVYGILKAGGIANWKHGSC